MHWREVKSVIVIGSVCALERSEVCYCHWICLCIGSVCALDLFVHWREVKSVIVIGSVCAVLD